jgi:hypothetical protein
VIDGAMVHRQKCGVSPRAGLFHLSLLLLLAAGSCGAAGGGAGPGDQCTTCEVAGAANGTCFNTSVDGKTNGCDGFTGAQRMACEALLSCLRTGGGSGHSCASGDDPTPCWCGMIAQPLCMTMDPATLPGVCIPQYLAANGGTDIGLFDALYDGTTSPISIANNMLTCDIDLSFEKFLMCPLSVCGVEP